MIFPYFRKISGPAQSVSQVHKVEIFYGARVSPYAGVFVETEFEHERLGIPIIRFALTSPKLKNGLQVGFVTGRMEPGGADPFNTLRKNTRMMRVKPEVMRTGEFRLWESNNWGGVVHGLIRKCLIYN